MSVESERLGEIRLVLHPSLGIVRSLLPALTIWRMNVGDGMPGPVDLEGGGEDTLIIRPAAEVEVRPMPPGGAEFATELAAGKSVTEAAKVAISHSEEFHLSANLIGLISAGAFVGWRFEDEPQLVNPWRPV